jgi:ABC-type lipoprotein export system ATPase subunit
MMDALYRLENVSLRYRARRAARGSVTAALNDVSLEIGTDELLVIRGQSGSGKSTLLHVLAGLVRPDSGSVYFDELPVHTLSEDELARVRGHRIGFVYQAFQLVDTMTALENTALPLLFRGVEKRAREEQAGHALEELGLYEKRERYPYELSGGEQQRVAIARARIIGPAVLLADEPTGSLDTASADRVLEAITRVHEQRSVATVLVTHDDQVARRMATRTIELRDGQVVA